LKRFFTIGYQVYTSFHKYVQSGSTSFKYGVVSLNISIKELDIIVIKSETYGNHHGNNKLLYLKNS